MKVLKKKLLNFMLGSKGQLKSDLDLSNKGGKANAIILLCSITGFWK